MIKNHVSMGGTVPRQAASSWNWSLVFGVGLVLCIFIIAIFGPSLAPQDPMKTSYVVEHNDRFLRPPFPPGVKGYPLGSDEVGRDILSRLLWAIRPTLILVFVVAAGRLSLGILIGILSSWTGRGLRQVLDTIISNALAIPVLFVSLCVIAALANRWGVWAFILGLSLTGWAEAARLVQGQTRQIRAQPFVEAARAMGANGGQMILSHVIPHIMSLVWIQMAFEVSSSLLTTAALGFLGYFVNAVWVPTDSDFIALRASGLPELGQMLGISLQQPWTAVFAGSAIFLIVLAFNMLGEGLRIQLNPESHSRRSEPTMAAARAGSWISDRVYMAATEWRRTAVTGGIFLILLTILLGGGWALWLAQNSRLEVSKITTPGGNLWPIELHDAQGTSWTTVHGPTKAVLLWTYLAPDEFVGGPVVDLYGDLYLNVSGRKLVIVGADGQWRNTLDLPAEPVGWPALTADGNVIAANKSGGLAAYDGQGIFQWEYTGDPPSEAIASPIIGPSGIIYYLDKNFIIAVTSEGKRTWQIQLPTFSFTSALLRLSPDGKRLFFEDYVVDAETGKILFNKYTGPADKYLVGADGKIYFRTADHFLEWQETKTGAVMVPRIKLDTNVINSGQRFPYDTGISPSGNPWLLFTSNFEYFRLIWTDPTGNSPQVIDFPYRRGRFIGIDADGVAYICGLLHQTNEAECRAVKMNSGVVLWKVSLQSTALPVGGAIIEGRLYAALNDGMLIAIGQ